MAGAVFSVLNPTTRAAKLEYIVTNCGARALVTEPALLLFDDADQTDTRMNLFLMSLLDKIVRAATPPGRDCRGVLDAQSALRAAAEGCCSLRSKPPATRRCAAGPGS